MIPGIIVKIKDQVFTQYKYKEVLEGTLYKKKAEILSLNDDDKFSCKIQVLDTN
jgi:hypothetical protein